MNQGKYVFYQLTGYLPQRVFYGLVKNHNGNKYVKHFTCWNQLLCMLFGQLTNRESPWDLIVALDAHSGKSHHLGLCKAVPGATLLKQFGSGLQIFLRFYLSFDFYCKSIAFL